MKRLAIAAARRAREEGGFTIAEVLMAVVVLGIGLGAVFQLMIAATHATATNKLRQSETSLARELTEDTRSLSYTQLTPSGIASGLASIVPNAAASSQQFTVTTTQPPASVEWLVNGNLPTSQQRGSGDDPYTPDGANSQFTWNFPVTTWNNASYTVDGTYTISALAFDANGNQ